MLQHETENCIQLIDIIRQILSRIPAETLKKIFLLYENISSMDPCSGCLKNAVGLLLALKRIWETPLPNAKK